MTKIKLKQEKKDMTPLEKRIIIITGGLRSGKTALAMKLAICGLGEGEKVANVQFRDLNLSTLPIEEGTKTVLCELSADRVLSGHFKNYLGELLVEGTFLLNVKYKDPIVVKVPQHIFTVQANTSEEVKRFLEEFKDHIFIISLENN